MMIFLRGRDPGHHDIFFHHYRLHTILSVSSIYLLMLRVQLSLPTLHLQLAQLNSELRLVGLDTCIQNQEITAGISQQSISASLEPDLSLPLIHYFAEITPGVLRSPLFNMPPTLIIGGYGGTSLKFKPTMFKFFLYFNTALALAYQLLPPKYSFYSLTLSMY